MTSINSLSIFSVVLFYCCFVPSSASHLSKHYNIYNDTLELCSTDPMTGYWRNGKCMTGRQDRGTHVVCAEMTEEFLTFTKAQGNDLSTPKPWYRFPGLKPGDRWCLCALRWFEGYENGVAPKIVPKATNNKVFNHIFALDVEGLEAFAVDDSEQ